MGDLQDSNKTTSRDESLIVIADGETGSGVQVGVTSSNRLKVDSQFSAGTSQSWTKKLRYDDMNATTGGVARGTSITAASGWTQVYSYTGAGYFIGCLVNLETKDNWAIRIVIDGDEIFGTGTGAGILSEDITNDAIYDADPSGKSIPEPDQNLGFFWGAHDRFLFSAPLLIPIKYDSSVKVYVSRLAGAAPKKFRAGYATLTKG